MVLNVNKSSIQTPKLWICSTCLSLAQCFADGSNHEQELNLSPSEPRNSDATPQKKTPCFSDHILIEIQYLCTSQVVHDLFHPSTVGIPQNGYINHLHSSKLIKTAPGKRPGPQKETHLNQPHCFRCGLLASGSIVFHRRINFLYLLWLLWETTGVEEDHGRPGWNIWTLKQMWFSRRILLGGWKIFDHIIGYSQGSGWKWKMFATTKVYVNLSASSFGQGFSRKFWKKTHPTSWSEPGRRCLPIDAVEYQMQQPWPRRMPL